MSIVQTLIGSIVTSGGGGGGPPPSTYPVPGTGAYTTFASSANQTMGTAYDPLGAVSTVSNLTPGWYYTIKDGQFQSQFGAFENIAFFQGTTPTGSDVYGGFGYQNHPAANYAIQWVGYVQVPVTGNYNIYLTADDVLYFWIGTAALEGNYTFANRHHLVDNSQGYNPNSVTLTAGQYYPIRMWFQEYSGAEMAQALIGPAMGNALSMDQVVTVVDSINGHSPPPPTYTITPAASNVDEGSSLEFAIGGTNIPNGTYYWTVSGNGPFDAPNGSFTITDNAGSITVSIQANQNTDGAKAFTLSIRSVNIFGTVLATSDSITVNDTSLTPEAPFSLAFVQSQTDYLDVAASSAFNLGTTWTIEFWSRAAKVSTAGDLLTVMCQNYNVGGSIDLIYYDGDLQFNGYRLLGEPFANNWTHVALVSDGTNLVRYTSGGIAANMGAVGLNNTTDAIRIGARGPDTFQGFDGQLALIRISNTAKYTGTFTPTTTYGAEADTVLFLDSDTPLTDASASAHVIVNNGVTQSTVFPT